MSRGRFAQARAFKRIRRASGTDMSLTATTWSEIAAATNGPGTGGFDFVLAAEAGDLCEVGINGLLSNSASDCYLDIATIVGGAVVTYFSELTGTHAGLPGWQVLGGAYNYLSGAVLGPALVAGDLVGGASVTLRPMYRLASATAKTLYSAAANPLTLWAKNLGPADPN